MKRNHDGVCVCLCVFGLSLTAMSRAQMEKELTLHG